MNPWQLFWAPQFQFPFGGSVTQRIDPEMVFGTILAGAGNEAVEKQTLERVSYGRQLGWITELLLDIAQQTPPAGPEGKSALSKLEDIKKEIDALKAKDLDALVAEVEKRIASLEKKDRKQAAALRRRLSPSAADK